jgi:hypothetical protein
MFLMIFQIMAYIIAKRKRGDFIIAQTNYLYRCITERTFKMHPENAVDGVYVADKPLNVNSTEKDSRYVNVLEMPESSKVLYIGEGFAGADFDMILAPESRFEYVGDIGDGVHLWKCVGQPFFE